MKKILYLSLLLITLFIGSNKVLALDDYYFSSFYNDYANLDTLENNYSSQLSNLVSYYNTNFSTNYPYYVIYYNPNVGISLSASIVDELYLYNVNSNALFIFNTSSANQVTYTYNISTDVYTSSTGTSPAIGRLLYSSNFDLKFTSSCVATLSNQCYGSITVPSYSNLDLDVSYPQLDISDGDIIPTYESLTTGSTPTGFTSVNLSSYDYIVLSLKDYTQEPFNTTIYTQGSLCLTPVYNYGMQQKQDSIPGYQTQGCTEVYSSETPVNVYIIQSDLTNHAVYYIKQQQNTPTTIKVPTSIFNITYINSNNTDPQVVIGGRSYPVIPFNDLTDTANKSSNEGYISGRVCALGDVNCQAETMGMDISDLFTSPLTLLQTLWTSITSIFTIIATFISILPPTLQVFLYTSFMLGIILGIIKIIL